MFNDIASVVINDAENIGKAVRIINHGTHVEIEYLNYQDEVVPVTSVELDIEDLYLMLAMTSMVD